MSIESSFVNLESIDNEKVALILKSFSIDAFVADDGDVTINDHDNIYIKVDRDLGALRFFSYIRDYPSSNEVDKLVGIFNGGSSTIKYQKMTQSIMIEYGILLSGHIDSKLLSSTTTHFINEIKLFRESIDESIEVE